MPANRSRALDPTGYCAGNTTPSISWAAHPDELCTDYHETDGIVIPTKRRIHGWEGDYQLIPEPLLIAIDMKEITLH